MSLVCPRRLIEADSGPPNEWFSKRKTQKGLKIIKLIPRSKYSDGQVESGCLPPSRKYRGLGENALYHLAGHIRQPEVAAGVAVGKFLVV